jgi:hypothetical protein
VQESEKLVKSNYYAENKEARKAYQRDYYKANRHKISRQRELREVLDPEKAEKLRDYQRSYYVQHRQELLRKRRERNRRKKRLAGTLNPVSGTPFRAQVGGFVGKASTFRGGACFFHDTGNRATDAFRALQRQRGCMRGSPCGIQKSVVYLKAVKRYFHGTGVQDPQRRSPAGRRGQGAQGHRGVPIGRNRPPKPDSGKN